MENISGQTDKSVQRKDNFLIRALKGFVVGAVGMIPGASGGVIAVTTGIYRPAINAITGFFKDIKGNVLYLLPIGIGGVIGLLVTSRVVEWLLSSYQLIVMYALIGMVAGGIPDFLQEANQFGFKKRYLIGTALGLLLITGLALLENVLTGGSALPFNYFTAAVAGGILAVGVVIPGMSTSFILMFMGLYEPMLRAFNRFDIPMIACMGVGAVIVAGLLVLFVKNMFDKYHGFSYYSVLGFLLGTIVLIFPGLPGSFGTLILCMVLMAAGFVASMLMARMDK